ncbi:expressed unknown protein [Seminavis robusta]|uniref:Uncharacterized protein n=1 Tax=Seminavis robusta TaxID=568900 RepID=A0A9N8DZI1_9STRA|nr:expressed unknown protein [Seminavis robusta]|eukprot:Sro502_g155530.1 n/a (348) ;mRNA; f:18244-19287
MFRNNRQGLMLLIQIPHLLLVCTSWWNANSFLVEALLGHSRICPQRHRQQAEKQLLWTTTSTENNNDDQANNDFGIWVYHPGEQEEWISHSAEMLQQHQQSSPLQETLHWCRDFVVPLNLCPWAASSVTTPRAMQFYIVPTTHSSTSTSSIGSQKDEMAHVVQTVAQKFHQSIIEETKDDDDDDLKKVAIAFILIEQQHSSTSTSSSATSSPPPPHHWSESFPTFYDWFIDLEDDWIDQAEEYNDEDTTTPVSNIYTDVTLAAFHPDWMYGESDNGDGLDFEKRSPVPTITLVATETIDAAGPQATERIANHNAQVLQHEMTPEQIQTLYQRVVRGEEQAQEQAQED